MQREIKNNLKEKIVKNEQQIQNKCFIIEFIDIEFKLCAEKAIFFNRLKTKYSLHFHSFT